MTEVTLEEVLRNRERRVALQRAALGAFGRPLLSVTLVNPGPVKDTPEAWQVMAQALRALDSLMANRGWPELHREVRWTATGPEALLAVDAAPRELKQAAVCLEDEQPLGRLWDIDVIDTDCRSISRRTLGQRPRRCLLCGEDAHVCVRSAAHPLPALQGEIRRIIHAYREP